MQPTSHRSHRISPEQACRRPAASETRPPDLLLEYGAADLLRLAEPAPHDDSATSDKPSAWFPDARPLPGWLVDVYAGAGAGTAPNCCIKPIASTRPHRSTMCPSARRKMWTNSKFTCRP